MLQVPGMTAQAEAEVQDALSMLQVPAIVGQFALEVQTVALWMLQWPALGQAELLVHDVPVWMLQCPPRIEQSDAVAHVVPVLLHVPTLPQLAADMQLAWLMLHWPGCAGQLASDVQLAWVMLHVPGSGVQTGGAQVVTGLQGFSGSGGCRLHPGGLYEMVQTGSWHVCVPGRLQT
jgi:hypothetical protein